jgi:16S rRNA (cytosine967-C5)-methyltransferase
MDYASRVERAELWEPIAARLRGVPWGALPREVALDAVARVLEGAAAEREIDRALRAHRGFSREERGALAEAVFGVGLWRRRLSWHAGGATAPAALLDALTRGMPEPGPSRLADFWSLPDWLEAHLLDELGVSQAEQFCAAIAVPGPICLRANRLVCTREALAERLAQSGLATRPSSLTPDALFVETRPANLFGLDAWREGWFEPQDEGSQAMMALVGGASEVLDLCAGAGGKSLQLAAGGARVLAYDVDVGKLARLRTRAARARAGIEVVALPRPAECVLVDAPCSELGVLRRGPDARWRVRPELLRELPETQRELLATAARLARKRIVYVTCTVNRAENEEIAAWFETNHAAWRRTGTRALLPHLDGTDGFFGCAFANS